MTTIEKELANAYGEVIDAEIEATLASAEPDMPELSPEFRKKMEELIRTGKPNNKKKGLSKRGKRILIIAIAAVLALTLTACAVPEIRESIAGFFVKIFSDHVEYSDPDVTKETIEEEYGLVPIPEGFEVTSATCTDTCNTIIYMDDDQCAIALVQGAKGYNNDSIDNEHGVFSEYIIGDKTVRVYYSEVNAHAAWVDNGYYFFLSCAQFIELQDFLTLIESVQLN